MKPLAGFGKILDKLCVAVRRVVGPGGHLVVHLSDAALQRFGFGEGGHRFGHDGFALRDVHFLVQKTESGAVGPGDVALVGLCFARYDFEHGRFARSVAPDESDPVALPDDEVHPVEQNAVSVLNVNISGVDHGRGPFFAGAKVANLVGAFWLLVPLFETRGWEFDRANLNVFVGLIERCGRVIRRF